MPHTRDFTLADEGLKRAVWERADRLVVAGLPLDGDIWRRDRAGNIIKYSDYGSSHAFFAWRVMRAKETPASNGMEPPGHEAVATRPKHGGSLLAGDSPRWV
jgi:hypothetical protein